MFLFLVQLRLLFEETLESETSVIKGGRRGKKKKVSTTRILSKILSLPRNIERRNTFML